MDELQGYEHHETLPYFNSDDLAFFYKDDLEYWGLSEDLLETCCKTKYDRQVQFVMEVNITRDSNNKIGKITILISCMLYLLYLCF